MSRWFRFYGEVLDDPKVQRLPADLFKSWVNLLCLASKSDDGELPSVDDIAFALRMSDGEVQSILAQLAERGLIDLQDDKLAPHNWSARQHKSDNSTDRVKQFRKRRETVSETVSETPPDTDTEQNRTEKKDAGAVAPAVSDAPVYTDSTHELWGEGSAILGQLGVPQKSIRSNIGRWLRDAGDPVTVLGAIQRARDHRVVEPVAWITRAIQTKGTSRGSDRQAESSLVAAGRRRIAELDELIAREEQAAGRSPEGSDSLLARDAAVLLLPQRGRGVG